MENEFQFDRSHVFPINRRMKLLGNSSVWIVIVPFSMKMQKYSPNAFIPKTKWHFLIKWRLLQIQEELHLRCAGFKRHLSSLTLSQNKMQKWMDLTVVPMHNPKINYFHRTESSPTFSWCANRNINLCDYIWMVNAYAKIKMVRKFSYSLENQRANVETFNCMKN